MMASRRRQVYDGARTGLPVRTVAIGQRSWRVWDCGEAAQGESDRALSADSAIRGTTAGRSPRRCVIGAARNEGMSPWEKCGNLVVLYFPIEPHPGGDRDG